MTVSAENKYFIRCAGAEDVGFITRLDGHISATELERKIRDNMILIIEADEPERLPVGLLRYNLFWDNIPFCCLLYVDAPFQHKGFGRALMEYWEREMKNMGYGMVLTSTQVDEAAQHFYRRLGYCDCGALIINQPGYEQPMEMFMAKSLLRQ